MTEKQHIEAALVKCGLSGKVLKEFTRAVFDAKFYFPDLLERGYGKLELYVYNGEYERSWSDFSNPKPPRE